MWGALNNCQIHPEPSRRQRLGPLGMSSIKIKWQHLSNVPLLPLLQRCRCSNLHTMSRWNTEGIFMCLLWSHIILLFMLFHYKQSLDRSHSALRGANLVLFVHVNDLYKWGTFHCLLLTSITSISYSFCPGFIEAIISVQCVEAT